jgi:ATP-binding cassette subfamily F protein uup
MNYLSVKNVAKSFGEREILKEITFGINQGEKVALVGVNGSGKTTLFRMLTGEESPDQGEIVFRNGLLTGYLPQNPEFEPGQSIIEAVFNSSNPLIRLVRDYELTLEGAAIDSNQQERLNELIMQMDARQAWDVESRIQQILGKLGIDQLDRQLDTLSGGMKKRVAMARILIDNPDFLILDEPTNHLDLEIIEWLEKYLVSNNITMLVVTHDRYFLDNITTMILELNDGFIYSYQGNYNHYLEKKDERENVERSEVEKARNLYRRELDWLRRMPKARGTKAKYRIDAAAELKETASRKLGKDEMNLEVIGRRQGKKILELHKVAKSFNGQPVIENFSYIFRRGDRIGIIGPNGSGKSTLLNLMTGTLEAEAGEIIKGETTHFGYYTQEPDQFDPGKKLIEIVQDVAEVIPTPDGSSISASQFLQKFQFRPAQQYDFVGKLSGGEKRRLQLLMVLISNPNFLILDEPTNDLDIITLNILEEFLENFPGVLVLVSHDRYFMDRLVDHLFVFSEHPEIRDFPGNYTDFRLEKEAAAQVSKSDKEEKKEVKSISKAVSGNKLSYKEKREFELLEDEIAKIETQKAELLVKMNSGESDHQKLSEWAGKLEQLSMQLDQKTDRWLELSEKEG